jgi:SAM-dependent methyltransferase
MVRRLPMQMRLGLIALLRRFGLMPLINRLSNLRYALLKGYWTIRGENVLDRIYNDQFFIHTNSIHAATESAGPVAAEVMRLFQPHSIVDAGCGTGIYLRPFVERGLDVTGIDGSSASQRHAVIDPDLIRLADVTRPLSLGRRFDIALCFEVAEHIEPEASAGLVECVTGLSDTVLFTAATKGQGGHHHVNEQDREFWIDLFDGRGFRYEKQLSESMSSRLEEAGCVFWIYRNLFVFRNAAAPLST